MPEGFTSRLALESADVELSESQLELLNRVKEEVPLALIAPLLSEELWVREVLKDVDSKNPSTRTKALEMWGKYLGTIYPKGRPQGRANVEFTE